MPCGSRDGGDEGDGETGGGGDAEKVSLVEKVTLWQRPVKPHSHRESQAVGQAWKFNAISMQASLFSV